MLTRSKVVAIQEEVPLALLRYRRHGGQRPGRFPEHLLGDGAGSLHG